MSKELYIEAHDELIEEYLEEYPNADFAWMKKVDELEETMYDIAIAFNFLAIHLTL